MTWQERYRHFRDGFAEAMDARLYPIDHLDRLLESGGAGIWFSENAAIVAQIKEYPSGAKAVHGLVAAGDLDEIIELIPQAEAWGQANGCTFGMIESRPGWARAMRGAGYRPFQISIMKEL